MEVEERNLERKNSFSNRSKESFSIKKNEDSSSTKKNEEFFSNENKRIYPVESVQIVKENRMVSSHINLDIAAANLNLDIAAANLNFTTVSNTNSSVILSFLQRHILPSTQEIEIQVEEDYEL